MSTLVCSCPKCGTKVTVREHLPEAGGFSQMSGEPRPTSVTCENCGHTFPPENISSERGA
jgi:predicted nucleic-acid-binding Zn-ribbon protein